MKRLCLMFILCLLLPEMAFSQSGGGRMLSCPDPLNCPGNIRTMWQKTEVQAIEEWNGLVAAFSARRKIK